MPAVAVLHSLHLDPVCSLLIPFLVAFFKEAAQYGALYVSVGNDANVTQLKAKPMFPEEERVYMVAAIRWVTHAYASGLRTRSPAPTRDANLSLTTPRRSKVPLPQVCFDSYSNSFVAKGMGHDQSLDLDYVRPDIYFVNEDGDKEIKRTQCAERGIQYLVAERKPDGSLEVRSSTSIKAALK